jgi:hypothetical protein
LGVTAFLAQPSKTLAYGFVSVVERGKLSCWFSWNGNVSLLLTGNTA